MPPFRRADRSHDRQNSEPRQLLVMFISLWALRTSSPKVRFNCRIRSTNRRRATGPESWPVHSSVSGQLPFDETGRPGAIAIRGKLPFDSLLNFVPAVAPFKPAESRNWMPSLAAP